MRNAARPAAQAQSDEALKRVNAETDSLITTVRHAIASRVLDLLRAHEPKTGGDRAEIAASLHEDLRYVRAEFAGPRAQGVQARIACDLLRLYRVCPRERYRRAESCRGHARCFKRVDVPEPVFRRVAWMMLAARLPWITSGRAEERLAYESWIAGIEAGGG
jgi:hypothetical protein